MNDFRLDVKVRNNRLVSAIEKNYKSIRSFCVEHNLNECEVGRLCNLKASPIAKPTTVDYTYAIGWRKIALDISNALGFLPDEIWPEHMQDIVLQNNKSTVEVSADFVEHMISSDYRKDPLMLASSSQQLKHLEAVINTLDDKEKVTILGYFGFDGKNKTFKELAKELHCTSERARQILYKALVKLRHPTRLNLLDFPALEEDF